LPRICGGTNDEPPRHTLAAALRQLSESLEATAGCGRVERAARALAAGKQGIIQAFEFTHELAWNILKDYLQDQGNQNVKGSKDATREAFKVALIVDGEQWMAMIQSRNISSHTYDERTAERLVSAIIKDYFPLFVALQAEMEKYLP
jgi:nucleotidyltransferase substrate binding protein (TIGR01987 family)